MSIPAIWDFKETSRFRKWYESDALWTDNLQAQGMGSERKDREKGDEIAKTWRKIGSNCYDQRCSRVIIP